MELQFIPVWDVPERWAEVAPLLEKALQKQTAMSAESLLEDCKRGKFWLWHVSDKAAFVTEIQQFPLERICMIVLCGGEDIDLWLRNADAALCRHARHFGCSALMIVGRRGWSRVCPEYEIQDYVMRRAL